MRTASPPEPWQPNPHATGIRRRVGELVLHPAVQNFIIAVIIVNAVTLGLETSDAVMARAGGLLHVLDVAALVIFIIELAAKMFALGRAFWRDGWNVFDFLVVAIALIPSSGPLAVLRALRVLRVLRLVNRLPQLRRIAEAIIRAIPGIGAIAALMAIIFYVGAVMATVLFGDSHPEMFGSIPTSLLTLFQVMTLDSWALGVVVPVMDAHPSAWLFFIPFILVSAFVMLNLFIAVIVDTMSNLHETAPEDERQPLPHDRELAAMRHELAEIKALLLKQQSPGS
ncbi:ion transporter [Gulosibacter sp. ACHW.36C]|uniref:Ion transporter n=1 Tax=Gulosibacter sediminis TaxID=1729695 RepID=A0ABY4N1G5_9MICO|nr:ion transporter [Gulosibacter sediminis]UQN15292.1 ion transporter [Gulosibacter sediminis]